MELDLIRVGESHRGTFGVLRYRQIPFALTLERPWLDNAVAVSCIPPGRYVCRRVRSAKFGITFEVTEVPGRSHILFHKGNTIDDTEGCILVAEEFSGTFDKPMIVSSERGYREFMLLLDGLQSFDLTIVPAPGQAV